jgi:hypothetical protein
MEPHMWSWRRKKTKIEGFPKGFRVQRTGISAAKDICNLQAREIAEFLRANPGTARALLHESYDKRFSPSTFIEQTAAGYRVGWFTRNAEYECVQEFSNLADAATDYLLFSLGTARWTTGKR